MFKKFISKLFGGNKQDRDIKALSPIADQVNEEYAKLTDLTNDELREKTLEFRSIISEHLAGIDEDIASLGQQAEDTIDFSEKEQLYGEIDALKKERNTHIEDILLELMPEAFAVVKETARRFTENPILKVKVTDHDRELAANLKKQYVTIDGDYAHWKNEWQAGGATIKWNMVHYDVQLMGGAVLHQGKIAEMATGEGKTLVATLPSYLNALAGQGVHVITVNDYLAKRDCEWIGPIMEFLFLTIDCIDNYRPHSEDRVKAYGCDITYGTNNEFGFDYLRDNMVSSPDEIVQSRHHFAMVDEIDSVLIDDARTPLIISGPIPKGDEIQEYESLKPRVEELLSVQRRLAQSFLNEAKKKISEGDIGPEEGEGGLSLFRAFRAMPKYRPLIKYIGEQGIKSILEKTENHYLSEQGKNMPLADEPLYFTLVEKNRSIDLTENGVDFLSRGEDDPNFFVMPDMVTNMQEIDESDLVEDEKTRLKEQLVESFTSKSKRLHSVNQLLKAYSLFEKDVDYLVQDGKVKIVDEQTGRTMDGRRYSDGLHQALEAKESVKIEAATQTYATITLQNFFRMYHKLCGMTGTAETEAGEFWEIYKLDVVVVPTNRPIARDDKEDLVYKSEREKYNALIEDVVALSESGRPVLVGTTNVEVSEKLSRMLRMRKINHNVLNAKQHGREAQVVAEAGRAGQVTIATNMAGRGTDIKISEEVKAAGGLAIVGTERHDSRRVDRQLRGRAGRQGDPGSSQFYVSLQDKLMRLFHSEKITKLMDRMGHEDGDVIQHSMVTKSIQRAQKKVEENNFGIRKRLLEYDDVMNIQRKAIYNRRKNALSGDRLSVDVNNMLIDFAEDMVLSHKDNGSYELFVQNSLLFIGLKPSITEDQFISGKPESLVEVYQEEVVSSYYKKMEDIRVKVMPHILNAHNSTENKYKRIEVPFTNDKKALRVVADIEEGIDTEGKSIIREIEKGITLSFIDTLWKEHLREMDELKEATQAASFEQKDPLVVYKLEAYNYFEKLVNNVNREVTNFLVKGYVPFQSAEDVRESKERKRRREANRVRTNRQGDAAAASANQPRKKPKTVKRQERKIGQNEPCPCGSGKKYKKCHGKRTVSSKS